MSKIYKFPMDLGHAYGKGSGTAEEAISGVAYLNFPPGYAYMKNFAYRQDSVLRPSYAKANFGGSFTSLYGIFKGKGERLFAITDESYSSGSYSYRGKIYTSINNGTTWSNIPPVNLGSGDFINEFYDFYVIEAVTYSDSLVYFANYNGGECYVYEINLTDNTYDKLKESEVSAG